MWKKIKAFWAWLVHDTPVTPKWLEDAIAEEEHRQATTLKDEYQKLGVQIAKKLEPDPAFTNNFQVVAYVPTEDTPIEEAKLLSVWGNKRVPSKSE